MIENFEKFYDHGEVYQFNQGLFLPHLNGCGTVIFQLNQGIRFHS